MDSVVDGVSADIECSTLIATSRWDDVDEGSRTDIVVTRSLYRSRTGGFYLRTEQVWQNWDDGDRDHCAHRRATILPVTREKAQGWLLHGHVEIVNGSAFEEPLHTEEGTHATLSLNVPSELAERWREVARKDGLSLDTWLRRCAERCLDTEG